MTHEDIVSYVKRWLNDNIEEKEISESVGEDSANLLQKVMEMEEDMEKEDQCDLSR